MSNLANDTARTPAAGPPVIALASGVDEALAVLRSVRRDPGGVRSSTGEIYELPAALDAVVASDPWRARLTPWALHAIAHPDEAWLFSGGEPTDEPIEHRPHIVVARAGADAPPRAIEVGTRRVAGRMRVQTWYQVVHPLPLIEGYWEGATRFAPADRKVRAHDDRERDVLILTPDPPEPWDGHWLPAPTGLLMLERVDSPVPIWIGMEIHEFRAAWPDLAAHPPFRGLLASPVSIDGAPAAPLVDQLTHLAARRS